MKFFILRLSLLFTLALALLQGCAATPVDPDENTAGGDQNGFSGQGGGVPVSNGCTFDSAPFPVGSTRCENGEEYICSALGIWSSNGSSQACAQTLDPCAEAQASNSYIGCEYWPVDLDNAVEVVGRTVQGACGDYPGLVIRNDLRVCVAPGQSQEVRGLCDGNQCPAGFTCDVTPVCVLDAQASRFTIVVSNPSTDEAATVTLEDAFGQNTSVVLQPGELMSMVPQDLGWMDLSVDGTSQNRSAYRLSSDNPIVAYQFNPLDNEFVFSNDGSLLLPSHAFQDDYFVLTLPTLNRRPFAHSYHGYFSIVAWREGETRVRVITSADIAPGIQTAGIPARTPAEFTLNQFDVLHLEAAGDGDLTGSRIQVLDPNRSVGVYVGHEAAVLTDLPQNEQTCCADHMEEQLVPTGTWGEEFVLGLTQPRSDRARGGAVAPDFIRILARADNTELTITPPASGGCPVLNAGRHCDLFVTRNTRVTATEPVLMAHFLLSTDGERGDPAMSFTPPVEQFRDDYTFLTPQEYQEDYITVVAKVGGPVTLDGVDILNRLSPIDDQYLVGVVAVEPGQHNLQCSESCSVLVYGFSEAVSYLFAGGLDLELISSF